MLNNLRKGKVREMKSNRWCREDVMDYFGEWIESEEMCNKLMEIVEERVSKRFSQGFSDKMSEVRTILIEDLGKDVRFMVGYRRAKK